MVQGVGYPEPNLSHFRSIEIWDTGAQSESTSQDGWLTRAFATPPSPASFAADGVVVGSAAGAARGAGTRAIALANPEQFLRNARLAQPAATRATRRSRTSCGWSATSCGPRRTCTARTRSRPFPRRRVRQRDPHRAQIAANEAGVAVVRVTLNGFDTHANQRRRMRACWPAGDGLARCGRR